MPRPTPVLLDADPGAVERVLVEVFRAVRLPDGRLVAPLPEAPAGNAELRVEITAVGNRTAVTLTVDSGLRVPYFRWFVIPLVAWARRRAVRDAADRLRAALAGAPAPEPRRSALLPPVRFTQAQVAYLTAAAFAAAVADFGASLFGQQAEYVRRAFDASKSDLGWSLALTRVGVLVALAAAALADRKGRRRLLLGALIGMALANAVSAAAPTLAVFTVAQFFTRGFINAVLPLAAIAVVEEAPEGARAFSLAMLALATGAGYAVSVVLLPLSDMGEQAWRISFAISGISALLIPRLARHLKETHRFEELAARRARRGRLAEVFDRTYGWRFALLAVAAFVGSVFAAPAAQLTNTYLADERAFSATGIAIFRAVTNGVPGLIGIVIGGRLAETRGRKPVAVTASLGVALLEIVFFLTGGPVLWLASTFAIVLGGIAGPALAAFGTELFPTEVRGTSNGLLLLAGVLGSMTGLLLVTGLEDSLGGLGNTIALAALGPILVALLILPRLPEAAHRTLDDVSPPEV